MKNVTADFKRDIYKPERTVYVEVTIGSTVYREKSVKSLSVSSSIQPSEGYAVGATESKTLSINLRAESEIAYTDTITVRFGLLVERTDGNITWKETEWVKYGVFYIDELSSDGYNNYTIKACDAMIKMYADLPDTCLACQDLHALSEVVATATGLSFSGTIPEEQITVLSESITERAAVAYIASCVGGNAVINADGDEIDIVIPSSEVDARIKSSNYFSFSAEENTSVIKKIICEVSNDNKIEATSPGTGRVTLEIKVPIMTQQILNGVVSLADDVVLRGFSLEAQGDFSIEPGDLISVSDIFGGLWGLTVTQVDIAYSGGFRMSLSAKGLSSDSNSLDAGSNTSKTDEVSKLLRDYTTKTEPISANRVYLVGSQNSLNADFGALNTAVENCTTKTESISASRVYITDSQNNLDTDFTALSTAVANSTTKTEPISASRVYLTDSQNNLNTDFESLDDRVTALEGGSIPATSIVPTSDALAAFVAIGYVDE